MRERLQRNVFVEEWLENLVEDLLASDWGEVVRDIGGANDGFDYIR